MSGDGRGSNSRYPFGMPGIGQDLRRSFRISEQHQCSFCPRYFPTFQSLGGHMTTHRREIEEMRRLHEVFMEGQRARPQEGHNGAGRDTVPMIPLAPNYAFWEAYRRGDQPPPAVNYMENFNHQAVNQVEIPNPEAPGEGGMNRASEETPVDPVGKAMKQVEPGEEASSVNVDLSLKL